MPAAETVARPRFGDADPHPWDGPAPHDHAVHGIDVSRYQGDIDWPTARAHGVSFAWLKATEGGDRLDSAFTGNWVKARAAAVPRGAYHFWYHCRSGAEQADWFIAHVPPEAGALPPVLDVEWTPTSPTCASRPPAATLHREMRAFLTRIERHYGTRPMIYTTPDLYHDAGLDGFHGYEYWLRSVAAHPRAAFPGRDWTVWQHSGTGIVPGIPGNHTDLNVFAGSRAAWDRWRSSRAVA